MGRPRLYTEEERREKRRVKSAKWRAANRERSRVITRECEKRRAAKRALEEGRIPSTKGRPSFRTPEEKRKSRSEKSRRWYHQNKAKVLPKVVLHARTKRAAIKAGVYIPQPWGGEKLTEEERKLRGRVDTANRRARVKKNGGTHTVAEIKELWRRQKGKCAFCLQSLDKQSTHVDHYTPIALGGANDIANLRLLHDSCNLTKGALHPIDHALKQGLLCW